MTTQQYKEFLEVYFDKIPSENTRINLKARGYSRYPIKKCWTKRGGTMSDLENLGQIQSQTDKLPDDTKKLPEKSIPKTIKPKTTTKTPQRKPNRHATLPILKRYHVQDGVCTITDMECAVRRPVALPDGIYKSIDPVVLDKERELKDYVAIPTMEGERLPCDPLPKAVTTGKKMFSPILGGISFRDKHITSTDSYVLQIQQCNHHYGDGFIVHLEAYNLARKLDQSKIQYRLGKNMIQFTDGISTVQGLLIIGRYPDYDNEKIRPRKSEHEIINVDLKEAIAVARVEEENFIQYQDAQINREYGKYISGHDTQYRGTQTPIVSYQDSTIYIIRPVMN